MPASSVFTADPENFRGKPHHHHVDLTASDHGHWHHYSFHGCELLHVKVEEADFRFDSLMLIGDDLQYVAPTERPEFANIEAEVSSNGRNWKIGTLKNNVRVVLCTLWDDNCILMKL